MEAAEEVFAVEDVSVDAADVEEFADVVEDVFADTNVITRDIVPENASEKESVVEFPVTV